MRTELPGLAAELRTTERTLRRALRQGLLRAHRPSPRTVDLPVAERAYLRRVWPVLSGLREALRTEPAVALAVLFGSRARGDEQPHSDLDLLIRLRRESDPREVASRLSERLGLRVQTVTLEEAKQAPLLLEEILRDGRVVVDREQDWPGLVIERKQIQRAAMRERRRIDDEFASAFGPAA